MQERQQKLGEGRPYRQEQSSSISDPSYTTYADFVDDQWGSLLDISNYSFGGLDRQHSMLPSIAVPSIAPPAPGSTSASTSSSPHPSFPSAPANSEPGTLWDTNKIITPTTFPNALPLSSAKAPDTVPEASSPQPVLPPTFPSHDNTGYIRQNTSSMSATQPTPSNYDLPSHPPSTAAPLNTAASSTSSVVPPAHPPLPRIKTNGSTTDGNAYSHVAHAGDNPVTLPASTSHPIEAGSGPNGVEGSPANFTSRDGSSTNSPATYSPTASLAQSPVEGGLNSGNVGNGGSKPVLKMKRTGQNMPLSSTLHPRNSSYSPSQASAPVLLSDALKKHLDHVPKNVVAASISAREPNTQPTKPTSDGDDPDAVIEDSEHMHVDPKFVRLSNGLLSQPAEKPGKTTNIYTQRTRDGPWPSASTADVSKLILSEERGDSTQISPEVTDGDSDGEIKYETLAQPTGVEGILEDGPTDYDPSDNESEIDSEEEDEIAKIPTPSEPSSRQLFQPPDLVSDEYDEDEDDSEENGEEEEEEDDDASSASSSADFHIDKEPAVALPSANIQHMEEAYPTTILTMANPQRPYDNWLDCGKLVKAGPALFPDGYEKSLEIDGFPWICAVRSCRQVYRTLTGLINHFKWSHKKAICNDNMDGTLSLVGSYTKKNEFGRSPAVVVSKRPLNPNEPPMSVPTKPKVIASFLAEKIGKNVSPTDTDNTLVTKVNATGPGSKDDPSPPPNFDPKRSEQMWDYIKPFLKVHKSIPTINWVRHVIHLPRIRDIQWNDERNKDHPFKDSHPRDITAVITQVTGVPAQTPCAFCMQGKGPFIGCIMISPDASDKAKSSVLSCANCYYHCQQSLCTHYKHAVDRRERRSRLGSKPDSYNVRFLSDQERRKGMPVMVTQPRVPPVPERPALDQSPGPRPRLFDPSEIKFIEMACEDRPYKLIKGKEGEMVSMHGALIPERYDLDDTVPTYPWICPVRSCRVVFKKIANLGSHFVIKHRGALFNDNQDGTLSQVGFYKTPLPGSNGCRSLVISQNPLDEKEGPMAEPGFPQQNKDKTVLSGIPYQTKPPLGPLPKRTDTGMIPMPGNAKDLWNYMLPYLPKPLNSISSDLHILRLFGLPRKRGVQWRGGWIRRKLDDDKKQVLGLLVHLVGEERNAEKACTNCRKGQGPFKACHVLPAEASYESHSFMQGCANCTYDHCAQACSIKSSWTARAGPKSDMTSFAAAATAAFNSTGINKRRRLSDSDSEDESSLAARQRSEKIRNPGEAEIVEPKRKIVTLSLDVGEDKMNFRRSGRSMSSSVRGSNQALQTASSSALVHAGQVQSDDLLEMEDWEIAPGRIRETGAEQLNNIAFSKSYLETNQAVRVSADVSFRVDTIKSGHSLDLEVNSSSTSYCSLASGKLRVSIEGQPDFTIGPHGLFKIKPGTKASVQNRLYVDSVLHISTYTEG